jgi:hypothetical protein
VQGFALGVKKSAGLAADALASVLRPPPGVIAGVAMAGHAQLVSGTGSVSHTTNIYPQRADWTVQDAEALDARRSVLNRDGRNR